MAQLAARKPRGNLPPELTSFVGRRRELAAIRSTLSDARLLTLTGAGGVGKTRLALHAGRELSKTLPDGVWLVELQEFRNANLLPTVIMTALGMRDQAGRSPVSLLVDYLEDNATAQRMHASTLTCRQHGDTYIFAHNLFWLGVAAIKRGDMSEAGSALLEAIKLKRRFDDRGTATMLSIELLAAPALAAEEPIRAARLQGAGAGLRRRQRFEIHTVGAPLVAETAARVRVVMGDSTYAREFEIGAAMEHEEAVAFALGERSDVGPETDRTQLKGVVLGAREEEVGTLVAQGLSNKDIAARLFLSVRTVETHVHHLLNKLGMNSRTQIAVWFSEPRHS